MLCTLCHVAQQDMLCGADCSIRGLRQVSGQITGAPSCAGCLCACTVLLARLKGLPSQSLCDSITQGVIRPQVRVQTISNNVCSWQREITMVSRPSLRAGCSNLNQGTLPLFFKVQPVSTRGSLPLLLNTIHGNGIPAWMGAAPIQAPDHQRLSCLTVVLRHQLVTQC